MFVDCWVLCICCFGTLGVLLFAVVLGCNCGFECFWCLPFIVVLVTCCRVGLLGVVAVLAAV